MSQAISNAAHWDQRFAGSDYLFGTEPNVWLARQASLLMHGGRALAVADGEGRNSVWLAEQGMQVDAFDISNAGVEKARKLAAQKQVKVNFQVCGCEEWPWQPAQYDLVVAIFIQFADPVMRATLFANMINTLKPGGILLLQGYTPKQLEYKTGGPPLLSHLYTEELLREAFSAMEIIELQSYEDQLHEGEHHKGQSALIGMVAKKL
jgi:2-polyprenyl-3-methyl-5-hydroxy-6-metoxy-1,4-benzoquinol methylase